MILLNKLVKPFEHLLASDHKRLFLKLFYSANRLSIAAFNIMPSAQQASFVLDHRGKAFSFSPLHVSCGFVIMAFVMLPLFPLC